MRRVTGIGGIFFKARDPEALSAWYATHLGIALVPGTTVSSLSWRDGQTEERPGSTIWAAFPMDATTFAPSTAPFMINYRVEQLDALLDALRTEGVTVDERVEESEFGRFGWVMDPEGNRVELWEPAEGH